MRVLGFCFALVFVLAGSVQAEKVAYTKDVAPILYEKCLRCHRAGEMAPMSLRNYSEARPWAKAIKEKVVKREMPPWFADPAHGEFSNNPSLTEEEIATIVAWVDEGAVRGNPKDMPEYPGFTEGWQNGEPDQVILLPEVKIPAEGSDIFPNLMFKAEVDDSRWIQSVEIRPTNREVAHHVVIFQNGFGGGTGMSGGFDVLGTWAVGTEPSVYPEGMGRRIKNGQTLMANMHYHPNGTATTDVTKIGLYHGEGKLKNEITATLGGSFGFRIPAGAANHTEVESWHVAEDIKIISLFPHMHLRGKAMQFKAVYPDGKGKILLDVPAYSFDWQLFYYPKEPIVVPAGSKIEITAVWDNSEDNPNIPDPTRTVGFGLESTDEMMFGVFEYVYADGDKETTD
ncbi:MAG: alkyl hydroperoxide reductase [Candidatus Hydrogenedentota bacterium]